MSNRKPNRSRRSARLADGRSGYIITLRGDDFRPNDLTGAKFFARDVGGAVDIGSVGVAAADPDVAFARDGYVEQNVDLLAHEGLAKPEA